MKKMISSMDPKKFRKFVKFMRDGMIMGSKSYGKYAYLNKDVFRMAKEELRDLADYAYFLYLKLEAIEDKWLEMSKLPEVTKKEK